MRDPPVAAGGAGPSIRTIVRRSGSSLRICSIFASCSSSSHTIALAPESEITHWHSSGEFVG